MSNRTIERSMARAQYAKFCRTWRNRLREVKLYGDPKAPKKPTFSQWFHLHEGNNQLMKESTPEDVAAYLYQGDPWANTDHGQLGAPGPETAFTSDVTDHGEVANVTIPMGDPAK